MWSPRVSADRVGTVKRYLRYRGFSSKVCHLFTSAIKGCKAMLNSVLAIRGLDLNNDQSWASARSYDTHHWSPKALILETHGSRSIPMYLVEFSSTLFSTSTSTMS
ncbi:hypothetical protein E2C01_017719 [Portunus trituberculatus]|uniref:Uncharacterized protein n=1 Tax=Portunus trituberculatus TaxID=210409 RepID=A0A5B7DSK6_PORTR|nr:hypothetical protein [Portunus trituberculatus]